MIYIGEENKRVDSRMKDSIGQHIMEYHTEKKDFFLNVKINWSIVEGNVFELKIGGASFLVPSGMFVMVGDEYGNVDWMKVDELISSPLDIMALNLDCTTWVACGFSVSNISEEELYWPSTKHIIPVQDSGMIILLSERDQQSIINDDRVEIFTEVD